MCTPDSRYIAITIANDEVTFNGHNRVLANRKVSAAADFDLLFTGIKHGGVYNLIVTKTVAGDVIITLPADVMLLKSGLGGTITLTGADETKFLLEIGADANGTVWVNAGAATSGVDLSAYAPLASPALTGNPTAPTQTLGNDSTRLATTAFVQAALAALVDSSPAALDTLNELAAALGDDANFATTITNALANKLNITADVDTKVTSGGAYTVTAADNGKILRFTDGTAVTVNLPEDMPVGFNIGVLQDGAGQVTFSAEVGATLQNRQTHTKTAGQRAVVGLFVVTNAGGSAAVYNLNGDTAA
jgi:hypothetical protein